ncbi:VOC family protein [Parasphingorhabdus sp.]|uniref:VOC family protein n=1 Tax=Parasphingorhabdus sp. TaxID=2709688 RepID=UPI003A903689|tara:strand:- start:16786 stop:17691 length:906 start_codon:yes stop_codon:yes gene_type:complete
MADAVQHGTILGGIATVPDLEVATKDYREVMGMQIVENGTLSSNLAGSWGCPNSAGAKMSVLQPASGAECFIRLVEQPDHPDFKPTTTYGWAAFELSVQDVFGWPDRLQGSGFDIVGPPKELEGMPFFVPMQVLGTGREMIYLNEVREDMPSTDLPKALSLTDQIFIVILASPDRAETVQWYEEKLGLDAGDTFSLAYSMINNAFGLPADTRSDLTMVQCGRLPIVEVDDYPAIAKIRARHDGMLPPGNALVTLAVDDFRNIDVDWITPPEKREAMPYSGRRSATVKGPAGELLELIEIGK